MKNIFLLVAVFFFSSCYNSKRGSGKIITAQRNTGSFNAIKVSNSIDVDVQQGNESVVTIEADDNIIAYIETKNNNGQLHIGLKSGANLLNATLKVHVICADLTKLSASASSEIITNGIFKCSNKLDVNASNSASIKAEIDAPLIVVEAHNSAEVKIKGKTKDITLTATNSADIDAQNLQAENATAKATNSGKIYLFASVSLSATATNSSDIFYTGGVTDVTKTEKNSGNVSAIK
ncbi:MAG: head GIN domain-containing protein [Ferruginibacter sp.]|nr:DUF2807 domain-containing protein [Ferruginibacter sp.]